MHIAVFRDYSLFCAQSLFLAVLEGSFGMLGIETGSAACGASALSVLL